MTLDELERELQQSLSNTPIVFALLFGSSITSGPDAARDIDLAIRAPSISLMERGALAVALEREIGKAVDIIEVDEAHTLLQWEIIRTGRPVLVRDLDALRTFQTRVAMEYADLRPYLDREAAGLRRSLGV